MQAIAGLELVTKDYAGVRALDSVTLSLLPGRVHAILGENGAGKTTAMRILAGLTEPTSGTVVVDGHPHRLRSRRDSARLGIAFVQQHFSLIDELTPEQNLALGDPEPRFWFSGDDAARRLTLTAGQYGIPCSVRQPVATLSVGEKQRLELLISVSIKGTRLLILDEPTAALGPAEFDVLKELLVNFKLRGLAIAYISHRLPEIEGIADDVTVLRQGRVVWQGEKASTSTEELTAAMVGPLDRRPRSHRSLAGATVTRLHDVRMQDDHGRPALDGLDLDVHAGEILGIAGVSGNGQEHLTRILARLTIPDSGLVEPPHVIAAYIPEDRATEGLALAATVADNAIARQYRNMSHPTTGWLRQSRVGPFVKLVLDRFQVRADSPNVRTENLSGGNQQRLVLGRELDGAPALIVAHNPTRGLDVRSSLEVWNGLVEARNRGAAVVAISPDLVELIEYSDRIVVIYQGRIVGQASPEESNIEWIGSLMVGGGDVAE